MKDQHFVRKVPVMKEKKNGSKEFFSGVQTHSPVMLASFA